MSARDWYVAWIAGPGVAWDPVAHKRRDVEWLDISLTETEGSDATPVAITTWKDASASLRGKKWAFLSFEHPNGTLYPVAKMRRRASTKASRDGEAVLNFEAGLLPEWRDLRDAGLGVLQGLVGYHPALVSPRRRLDPTEVLDGHRRCHHFDRLSGAYSNPELLGEGLPSRTFGPDDWIGWESGGGIAIDETGQPLRGVQVTCAASWMQLLQGMLDLTAAIRDLFPSLNVGPSSADPKSLFPGFDPSVVIASGRVATLTPDEFSKGFPQAGATIAGASGYNVVRSVVTRVDPRRFAEGAQPASVGPVYGSKGKFVYVRKEGEPKPDPLDPFAINLDVTYFDVELVLAYVARVKREETVSFLVLNAACTDPDAPIKTLDLRTEDPSIDGTTTPWLPQTAYSPGDVRRFGWNCWLCRKAHVSGSFAADVQAGRWELALADQSYVGGPGGITFWHTPAGLSCLYTVILKAIRPMALAQRRKTFEWSVPFEDIVASGFSTAWRARIEADDVDLPGGWAEGKVVSLTIRDSAGGDGYAKATIRIAACDGTGQAGAAGPQAVSYTGQDWDRVTVAAFGGYPPSPGPVPGGEAFLENDVAAQLAYVRERDYRRGVAGRSDATASDPKQLLRAVPTKITFAMSQIAGGGSVQDFLPLAVSAWPGPRQCNLPSPDDV